MKRIRIIAAVLVLFMSISCIGNVSISGNNCSTVQARSSKTKSSKSSKSKKSKKVKKGWYMSKKGRVYYYDDKGKMVKSSIKKINNKYYFFDKKGKQHVGWIKAGKYYYYFNIAAKKKGYMIKNKTINGIKLDSKGRAVSNKDKARLLARAHSLAFSVTNFKMSQREKNKAVFLYIRNNTDWRNLTGFRSDLDDWAKYYAQYAIFKGYGDCYCGGCGFAYMATAVGAKKVYAVSSGGHGWAKIGDTYYDPNWSWAMKNVDDYFDCPESLSGHNGRPDWAGSGAYVTRVD